MLEVKYASLTVAMDKSAKEWTQSETNRAYLTVCLLIDYMLHLGETNEDPPFELNILENPSYTGRKGLLVVVMIYSASAGKCLVIAFDTRSSEAAYYVFEWSSRLIAETALEDVCEDGFYKNDVSDLYDVYKVLEETLDL